MHLFVNATCNLEKTTWLCETLPPLEFFLRNQVLTVPVESVRQWIGLSVTRIELELVSDQTTYANAHDVVEHETAYLLKIPKKYHKVFAEKGSLALRAEYIF